MRNVHPNAQACVLKSVIAREGNGLHWDVFVPVFRPLFDRLHPTPRQSAQRAELDDSVVTLTVCAVGLVGRAFIHNAAIFPGAIIATRQSTATVFAIGTQCLARPVIADSPFRNTDPAYAYADIAAVVAGQGSAAVSGEALGFLLADNPLDQKAIVTNALNWDVEAKTIAVVLLTDERH